LAGATLPSTALHAQSYPDRPVKVIVSSAPGGIDTIVRLIAPALQERAGQPFVVDNKAGANGILGVQAVTSSPADGYTILFTTISTLTINPFVYQSLPYHPLKDLEPIALHATLPMVWVAHPARGFRNLKDVVAYAKANPGKLTIGNPGNGSFGHLLQEALRKKHAIDVTLVPFKTTPQAMTETLAGRVDVCVDNLSNLMPHISQDKLVPLAVTSRQRSSVLPKVASWLEEGVADFEAVAWYAFMAPKGTPQMIVEKLNADITAAIQSPAARKYLESTGANFVPRSPAKVREFIQAELDKYGPIAKGANITLQ
jgi:tripartite-type tricarboxylate transporter receptor subunit TctC